MDVTNASSPYAASSVASLSARFAALRLLTSSGSSPTVPRLCVRIGGAATTYFASSLALGVGSPEREVVHHQRRRDGDVERGGARSVLLYVHEPVAYRLLRVGHAVALVAADERGGPVERVRLDRHGAVRYLDADDLRHALVASQPLARLDETVVCENVTCASAPCDPKALYCFEPMSTTSRAPNAVAHRAIVPTLCFFAMLCTMK